MKKFLSGATWVAGMALLVGVLFYGMGAGHMGLAWARGWGGMGGGGCPMSYSSGQPGGGDFVPQAQRGYPQNNQGPTLTLERAHDIAAEQVAKTSRGLTLGQGRDAGRYYEFFVLSQGQTVERLAVDKASGLTRPLD